MNFAENLHQELEFFDPSMLSIEFQKTSIQKLEQTVDRELVDSSKEIQTLLSEIGSLIDVHFAEIIDKRCQDEYKYGEQLDLTDLWHRVGHKYLGAYDVQNQAVFEKYKSQNALYKKNEAAFNNIKKPSKFNLVGRCVYYVKEKILQFEARSVETSYKEHCISDKKFQEQFNKLNEIDNQEAFKLFDRVEVAINAYSEAIHELGTLKSIKMKIEKNDNKQVYLEGFGRNKNDIIKNADFFEKQLVFFSKNKTIIDSRTNKIHLVNPEKKQFHIANQGKTLAVLNEPYYHFDPIDRMKKIDISYQKGEELYTLKTGYCYVVDPENRRRGGDDETRGYVAVVDKKGEIVADFIEDYKLGADKTILEGKLAVATLLRDYDLQQSTNIPNKLDFVEFNENIRQFEFGVEEIHPEYIDMIEDAVERMFSTVVTKESKKEVEKNNHLDKSIELIEEIQKNNKKGTSAEVEYCNQVKTSEVKSHSVDVLALEDEKIMRKMLCSGKFTSSQIGDAIKKCSPVQYKKDRNVVQVMKKITEDPEYKKQLLLKGRKI